MLNTNAFRRVVHKKKSFEDFSQFSLFLPLIGSQKESAHYLNKYESPSSRHVSY